MSYAYPQPVFMQPEPPMRRSAPVSVHFIAILYYLGGTIYLLAAAGAGLVAYTGTWDDRIRINPDDRLYATIAAVAVLAVIGLITMWFGRRLQLGRNWARILLNMFLLLSVAAIGYATWVAQDPTALIALIQPAFFLLLLNTRAARSWFKHHTW
ncbi:hypothetical protein AB0M54_17220 [Actinoplanes sp. NPDC051470]|uniref:hypothetical protein n=1 Tax=unclassified Actinoplanes TaxID=2626549 RepID=UPI003416DD3F